MKAQPSTVSPKHFPSPPFPSAVDVRYSIVLPIYNEEPNLPRLFDELIAVMGGIGEGYEVVCVDDGSTDGSRQVIRLFCQRHPSFHLVGLGGRQGQSAAMWAGFQRAAGEYIITLDADLQNDPADIPLLIACLTDCEMVCGWRQKRQDRFITRIASRIANAVRNSLTREQITDTGCSLKIMRRDYVKQMPPFVGMHRFLPTLMRLHGARVKEVPVSHRPRIAGDSKYGIWDRAFSGLRDVLGVRWLQDRHVDCKVEEEL